MRKSIAITSLVSMNAFCGRSPSVSFEALCDSVVRALETLM